jgi:hypothetical protein
MMFRIANANTHDCRIANSAGRVEKAYSKKGINELKQYDFL